MCAGLLAHHLFNEGTIFSQDSLQMAMERAADLVDIQGGAVNRGLFFADPPPLLLGAVSGKISEIR